MHITVRAFGNRTAAAALIIATAIACTDFEAPEEVVVPDVLVANPSFDRDIQPIFTARCATASCHNLATQQVGLNLQTGYSYDEIVDVGSPSSHQMPYIRPFDADSSWLVRMIEADLERRDEHPRMPLASRPLTENQIGNIRRWIEQGALDN